MIKISKKGEIIPVSGVFGKNDKNLQKRRNNPRFRGFGMNDKKCLKTRNNPRFKPIGS